jgi:type I site-specific deoxyribonuclease restriction subunit
MEYHISSKKTINSKKVDEKIADYVLYYHDVVVAVIEAKKVNLDYRIGLQQAIEYARLLNTPYAYSTNGRRFVERNMITGEEKEIEMSSFPTKDEL